MIGLLSLSTQNLTRRELLYSLLISVSVVFVSLLVLSFVIGASLDIIAGYVHEVTTRERLDRWGTTLRKVTSFLSLVVLLLVVVWTIVGAGWVIFLVVSL